MRVGLPLVGLVPVGVVLAVLAPVALASGVAATRTPAHGGSARTAATTPYPVGVFDLNEPSLLAPPGPGAMPGYRTLYVNDFKSPLRYAYWYLFTGVPKGDPVGRFERGHVAVHRGMLTIGTWRDPRHHDQWASGGICLCGVHPEYGAFFVRSRLTAIGPDDSEMLWPKSNVWPPEVDFSESGDTAHLIAWFDHFRPAPDAHSGYKKLDVLDWHTWGIVWTPTVISFVVDGHRWGTVTDPAAIPHQPMVLNLQQQTWCGIYPECPTRPSSIQVDWLEVYVPNPT